MKAIICSIPKSGTYLMGRILVELGYQDTHLHLGIENSTDYSKSDLQTSLHYPDKLQVNKPLQTMLKQIKDNFFAVGHLPPSVYYLLKDFNILFIYRNLRYVVTSYCRWTVRTGRWKRPNQDWRNLPEGSQQLIGFIKEYGQDIYSLIKDSSQWIEFDKIIHVKYEDLVEHHNSDIRYACLQSIASSLGKKYSNHELDFILNRALQAPTLTHSPTPTDRRIFWNDEIENLFNDIGLYELNHQLGYEDNVVAFKLKSKQKKSQNENNEKINIDYKNLTQSYRAAEKIIPICPVCQNSDYKKIVVADRHNLGFTTCLCDYCGLVIIAPRPDEKWFMHFYKDLFWPVYVGKSIDLDTLYIEDRIENKSRQIVSILSDYFKTPPHRCLDIGAGLGGLLSELKKKYPTAILKGVEPSYDATLYCQKRHGIKIHNCDWTSMDINKLTEQYDLITMVHVLEHVLDPLPFIKRAVMNLAPNGLLYVEVPNILSEKWHGSEFLHIAHVYYFSEKTLRKLLMQSGLEVIKVFHGIAKEWPWAIGILAGLKKTESKKTVKKIRASIFEKFYIKTFIKNRVFTGTKL